MKFISPTWKQIFLSSVELAEKIRYDEKRLGKSKIEVIVGVSRGGLVLSRLMSDLLEVDNVMIAKSEYYTGMGKRNKKPVITQKIQRSIMGKNVLLVDDVSDSGESLLAVRAHLLRKKPKGLSVATLYLKPWSKSTPDYYAAKTDAWIIFPWELYESLKLLKKNGGLKLLARLGVTDREISALDRYNRM